MFLSNFCPQAAFFTHFFYISLEHSTLFFYPFTITGPTPNHTPIHRIKRELHDICESQIREFFETLYCHSNHLLYYFLIKP